MNKLNTQKSKKFVKQNEVEETTSKDDTLNHIIEFDIKILEDILAEYRSIRKDNTLKLEDLYKNNQVVKTNLKLLEEAALYTKDLTTKQDIDSHLRAKEAILLWAIIYCEKVLLKNYPSKRAESKEAIMYGAKTGVSASFKTLRDKLNKYFELPEEERTDIYKALGTKSVKSYMCNLAKLRTYTEFAKQKGIIERAIPCSLLKNCKKVDLNFIEEYKDSKEVKDIIILQSGDNKFYTCDIETKKAIFKELQEIDAKKNIILCEGKKSEVITYFYYTKFVSGNFTNKDTGDEFENPEVTEKIVEEVESEAAKLIDKHTIVREIQNIIKYMRQHNIIGDLEEEYIHEVMLGSKGTTQIIKEWVDRGEKDIPNDAQNLTRNLQNKFRKAMQQKKEWMALADLVTKNK